MNVIALHSPGPVKPQTPLSAALIPLAQPCGTDPIQTVILWAQSKYQPGVSRSRLTKIRRHSKYIYPRMSPPRHRSPSKGYAIRFHRKSLAFTITVRPDGARNIVESEASWRTSEFAARDPALPNSRSVSHVHPTATTRIILQQTLGAAYRSDIVNAVVTRISASTQDPFVIHVSRKGTPDGVQGDRS